MSPNFIILAIGLTAGALPTWLVTSNYYQGVIAKEHVKQQKLVIEQQEQNRLDLIAYAERITKAEVQRDKNDSIVVGLRHKLDGMLANLPACPMPGTTDTGTDSNGGAGLFYQEANRAFGELQKGDNADFERCDKLNVDAIRANTQQHAAPSAHTR